MIKYLLVISLLFTSLFSYDVSDELSIRSFATIDLTHKRTDTSYDTSTDYSIVGAQIDYDILESLNVMAQGIYSQRDRDVNHYEASLEWAMIGYRFGDGYQIRAGQYKVPFMNASDTQYIGYSRLWTRPLLLPNGTNGFEKARGLEFVGNNYIDDIDFEYTLSYGKAYSNKEDVSDYLWSAVVKATYDASWFRVSYGKLSFEHIDSTKPAPQPGDVTEGILTFTAIETKFNYENFDLYAGYAFNENDVIPDDDYKYLSLSYTIGKFIPYALYTFSNREGTPYGSKPEPGSPPPPPPSKDGFETIEDYSVGLRYNMHRNFVIKGQYTKRESIKHENPQGDEIVNSDIFTVSLDMVF